MNKQSCKHKTHILFPFVESVSSYDLQVYCGEVQSGQQLLSLTAHSNMATCQRCLAVFNACNDAAVEGQIGDVLHAKFALHP